MKESKSTIHTWLDGRFYTRRDKRVSKEGYYTFLGIKEDGTREVLSVVNHPTERALLWEQELEALKSRGLKSVGLFVSDALLGVEDAVKRAFAISKHQFCVVHLKKNILSLFPPQGEKKDCLGIK